MAAFTAALQFGSVFGVAQDAMSASAKAKLDCSPCYWHTCCIHGLELLIVAPQHQNASLASDHVHELLSQANLS